MNDDYLWWREGIIYQIYPRSFADSNGDGVGDLQGIIQRLDYLEELGVDALWLSPINPSPDVDFGYDVQNYLDIDPKFGTMKDFEELLREAHARSIHIILDLVLNHTSDQHPWFVESSKSKDNPYRDYYLWRPAKAHHNPPNNWQSVFGGKGWEFDPTTSEYYFHMFYKEQPDLNWRNPAVRAEMLNIFKFWLDKGVDGFRLDVFNAYFKHADMPDNPPKLGVRGFDRIEHVYDVSQPEMMPLLKEIRGLLDAYPARYVVGETFLGDVERAASYVGPEKLHGAFDFSFLENPWKPGAFLKSIQRWEHALAPDAWPNYVLNNHDQRRAATRFGQGEDDERMKVAAALLLTQRGTPFLYYGEEIGMRDIALPRDQIKDPIGRRFWPFHKGRDGCRSPMQWNSGPQAGFSSQPAWLPPHPNYTIRNVQAQRLNPDSLYNFYCQLIRLRREYPALRTGLFQPVHFEPRQLLAYLRHAGSNSTAEEHTAAAREQTMLVALNFSSSPRRLALSGNLANEPWKLLLSNKRTRLPALKGGFLPLDGNEVMILVNTR